MNTKDTGGSAFPSFSAISHCDEGGMTLRDYFAAKAMQGFLQGLVGQSGGLGNWFPTEIAEIAYTQADAMLAARVQGGAA